MQPRGAPTFVRIRRTGQRYGKQGHLHEDRESAVYVLAGKAGMWYGEELREHVWLQAGDSLYVPAALAVHPGASEPAWGG